MGRQEVVDIPGSIPLEKTDSVFPSICYLCIVNVIIGFFVVIIVINFCDNKISLNTEIEALESVEGEKLIL